MGADEAPGRFVSAIEIDRRDDRFAGIAQNGQFPTAAAALLDRWGLTWSDALAIGDGQNDVPMLREAGTSVAMANAKQSVRDAAQFGCASNADDGWVEAMERYVLTRL